MLTQFETAAKFVFLSLEIQSVPILLCHLISSFSSMISAGGGDWCRRRSRERVRAALACFGRHAGLFGTGRKGLAAPPSLLAHCLDFCARFANRCYFEFSNILHTFSRAFNRALLIICSRSRRGLNTPAASKSCSTSCAGSPACCRSRPGEVCGRVCQRAACSGSAVSAAYVQCVSRAF